MAPPASPKVDLLSAESSLEGVITTLGVTRHIFARVAIGSDNGRGKPSECVVTALSKIKNAADHVTVERVVGRCAFRESVVSALCEIIHVAASIADQGRGSGVADEIVVRARLTTG
jgi:hypothetical protein